MCEFVSAVCVYNGSDLSVYLDSSNSHQVIRVKHGLRERDLSLLDRFQTPVEFVPVDRLFWKGGWRFNFDNGKPEWWQDWMTERAELVMFRFGMDMWKGRTLSVESSLYLLSLKSIPQGVTIETEGTLHLGSVTTVAKGVTLKAGVGLNLISVTDILEGVTIEVNGDPYLCGNPLCLDRLTTIAKGMTLKTKGDLRLNGVASIAKDVTIEAGYALYMRRLKSIPEGVTLAAGLDISCDQVESDAGVILRTMGSLNLDSVTDIAEGVTLKAAFDVHLPAFKSIPKGVTIEVGGNTADSHGA